MKNKLSRRGWEGDQPRSQTKPGELSNQLNLSYWWDLNGPVRETELLSKWYMKCFIYWTADLKSSKLWSSQLRTQFKQLRIEARKSQDYNGVWTRDLAIPVRRSNQLSYEATDVGNWSLERLSTAYFFPANDREGHVTWHFPRLPFAGRRFYSRRTFFPFGGNAKTWVFAAHFYCLFLHFDRLLL